MFILISSVFLDTVWCSMCASLCAYSSGLFWQISMQSSWAKTSKKAVPFLLALWNMFCLLGRQQSPDGSQMPLFSMITLWPKSHHCDESEDHKRCISNLPDVTSLEIICKGPDLFIWKHINIWTPSFEEMSCKFVLMSWNIARFIKACFTKAGFYSDCVTINSTLC